MIAVLLADGFEEVEALAPVDFLRRCGLNVCLVSMMPSLSVSGSHGLTFQADQMLGSVDWSNVSAVVLPGGMPGTSNLDAHPAMDCILAETASRDGLLAAICAAPSILGKRGYLSGRKAVCYPGFESALQNAEYTDLPVICDGNRITARSAGSAWEFGYEIARYLTEPEICESVRRSLFLDFQRSDV